MKFTVSRKIYFDDTNENEKKNNKNQESFESTNKN